jgi:hypothetical protein
MRATCSLLATLAFTVPALSPTARDTAQGYATNRANPTTNRTSAGADTGPSVRIRAGDRLGRTTMRATCSLLATLAFTVPAHALRMFSASCVEGVVA